MTLNFIHLIRFRVDNARVFQRVSINLTMTAGQATWRLLCRRTESTLAVSCVCWIESVITCESGERTCGCSYLECTWSKVL